MNVPSIPTEPVVPKRGKLLRVLGLGFGLAVVIGAVVGVGILRTPGAIALQLHSPALIMLVWVLGGIYVLLDANYATELATMLPHAGGPYVYARRAYGDFGGLVVGWTDWLINVSSIGYIAVVLGEFAATLFSTPAIYEKVVSYGAVVALTVWNGLGVREGSRLQELTSLLKAIALVAFVIACFVMGGGRNSPSQMALSPPASGYALFVGLILAVQMTLETYAGWNSVVYFAEEDENPGKNIPRSVFGGIFLIIAIYLLVNVALLYVLPVSQIAGSKLAAADAMSLLFGAHGGQVITALALLSIVGILNATIMYTPRTLYAMSRDGLFTAQAMRVNAGGTPIVSLVITAATALLFIGVGTFETLLTTAAFFTVASGMILITALFILRRREPDLPRPYRTIGYPFTPLILLVVAAALFVSYIVSNPIHSAYAFLTLAISYPMFRLVKRREVRPDL